MASEITVKNDELQKCKKDCWCLRPDRTCPEEDYALVGAVEQADGNIKWYYKTAQDEYGRIYWVQDKFTLERERARKEREKQLRREGKLRTYGNTKK